MQGIRIAPRVLNAATCLATLLAACNGAATINTPGFDGALVVLTQPVASPDGALTTHPVVAAHDKNGALVAQAGLVITASIVAGSGTLTGQTTAITGSDGLATFTTLGIDGLGSQTLQFVDISHQPVTSSVLNLATVTLPSARFSAHFNTSCGMNTSATVVCWGENIQGQLADNSTTNRAAPTSTLFTGSTWVAVTVGSDHACAIVANSSSQLRCWGSNFAGQVGDSTTTQRLVPFGVHGGVTFASATAGTSHTCGLTADGTAFCWGLNGNGQIGDSTGIDRATPVAVHTTLKFTMLSAELHTCGLTAAGVAWCWGSNSAGQLGDGTQLSRVVPVPVSGNIIFASISARGTSTCGVTPNGVAWCWGGNDVGQLGDGTTVNRLVPGQVLGGHTFSSINTSGSHTCGLTGRGAVWCWGGNAHGQLGDGTLNAHLEPSPVSGGVVFSALVTGVNHTCGKTTVATVLCWGQNNEGQVGDGTFIDRPLPTALSGGVVFGGN